MGNRSTTLTASMWGSCNNHSNIPQNLSSWHSSPVGWKERLPKHTLCSLFSSLICAPQRCYSYVFCRALVIIQFFKWNNKKKLFTKPREKEKYEIFRNIKCKYWLAPSPPTLVINEKSRKFEMHFAHRLGINNATLHFISLIFPMGSLSSLI